MDDLSFADLYVDLLENPPSDEVQKLARKDAFIKLSLQFLKRAINNGAGRWNAADTGAAMVAIYQALVTVEAVLEELKKAAYPNYAPLPPPALPQSESLPPRPQPGTLPPDIAPVTPETRP